jgi:hypothetical protein
LLENFCKREEAANYKDFAALPMCKTAPRRSSMKLFLTARSFIPSPAPCPQKKELFSRLDAQISPSLSGIAVIVNQAVMVWWQ